MRGFHWPDRGSVAAAAAAATVAAVAVLAGCSTGERALTAPEARARFIEKPAAKTAPETPMMTIQGPVSCGRMDGTAPGAADDCLVIEDQKSGRRYIVANAAKLDPALFAQRRKVNDVWAMARGRPGGEVGRAPSFEAVSLKRLEVGPTAPTDPVSPVAKAEPKPATPEIKTTKAESPAKVEPPAKAETPAKAEPKVVTEPKTPVKPEVPVAKVEPKTTPADPKPPVKAEAPAVTPKAVKPPEGQVAVEGFSVCARDDRGDLEEAVLAVFDEKNRKCWLVPEAEKRFPEMFENRHRKLGRQIRVTGKPGTESGRLVLRDVTIEWLNKPAAVPQTPVPPVSPAGGKPVGAATKSEPAEPAVAAAEVPAKPAEQWLLAEGDLVCTRCTLGLTTECRPAVRQGRNVLVLTGSKVPADFQKQARTGGRRASLVGRAKMPPEADRLTEVEVVSVKTLAERAD